MVAEEGECSGKDESCAADNDIEPEDEEAEELTNCEDTERECKYWASLGECDKNPNYMRVNCALSCDSCPKQRVISSEERQLLERVSKFGERQRVEGDSHEDTLEVIRKTVDYMENDVYGPNAKYDLADEILGECNNKDGLCAFWASIGECEVNLACEYIYSNHFISSTKSHLT